MLRIGDFSKLSRISIRMLRHYDSIGLLKPGMVDEATGYRYYQESQLLQAGRIQALKGMGFGLNVIAMILERYSSAADMEHFLMIQKQETEEEARLMQNRLHLIDSTIAWLRKDGTMMGYDVSLKVIPERKVASVRQVIPSYGEEGLLWGKLMEETSSLQMREANPCYAIALFHDGEYKEHDVDVEVQMSVEGVYADTEHVKFKTVPSVQIASATFKGAYEQITQVNEAVAHWIHDNGYEYDGISFNIYHVSPKQTQNPQEYVTEVCYPVKKR